MVKNTLVDLHNLLMETAERLNDDDLSAEELDMELKRSKGIADIGKVICSNASNILQAQKITYESGQDVKTPRILIGNNND